MTGEANQIRLVAAECIHKLWMAGETTQIELLESQSRRSLEEPYNREVHELGSKIRPQQVLEWSEGFDTVRESDCPMWFDRYGEVLKLFPSGRAEDENGKEVDGT